MHNYYTKCLLCHHSDPLSVPGLTVNTSSTGVVYQVERHDTEISRVIIGYEVIRFGVPMLGRYLNIGTREIFTISPVVPGAQYRITAWALDSGTRRSATPAVGRATMREASEFHLFKTML